MMPIPLLLVFFACIFAVLGFCILKPDPTIQCSPLNLSILVLGALLTSWNYFTPLVRELNFYGAMLVCALIGRLLVGVAQLMAKVLSPWRKAKD